MHTERFSRKQNFVARRIESPPTKWATGREVYIAKRNTPPSGSAVPQEAPPQQETRPINSFYPSPKRSVRIFHSAPPPVENNNAKERPVKERVKPSRVSKWAGDLSDFGKFLSTHDIPREKVSSLFDVTPAYVSMLAHGKATPALKLSLSILRWTRKEGLPPFGPEDWGL